MGCESFIRERVVGSQKINHALIFPYKALDEEFSLSNEGLPQIVIELREDDSVRYDALQISEIKPLASEVVDQCSGP